MEEKEKMDLRSFLRYLQSERRYSAHTIKAYKTDLSQFSGFLSATYELNDLNSATHSHVRSWLVILLEDSIGARSINRKISALKSYYKFEMKRGNIQSSPVRKLITPKLKKRLPVFVNQQQMKRLANADEQMNDFGNVRNRLIIELLYATGMRVSELVNLSDNSFDFYNHSLKVLGKGNKERIIPLSKEMLNRIKEYKEVRRKKFQFTEFPSLFVTDSGSKMYSRLAYRVVHNLLALFTTAEKKSPHVLRHTFATHMLNNGAEINAIKDLLGHSSLAATQVYTHNTIEKLKDVYKKAHPKA
ncbi:MAG: tyrosine-type recombinase/integrase [Chitinophagales bacterium]